MIDVRNEPADQFGKATVVATETKQAVMLSAPRVPQLAVGNLKAKRRADVREKNAKLVDRRAVDVADATAIAAGEVVNESRNPIAL